MACFGSVAKIRAAHGRDDAVFRFVRARFGTGCGRSNFDDQLDDDGRDHFGDSFDGGDDTSDDTFDSEPPPDTFIPPDGPVDRSRSRSSPRP